MPSSNDITRNREHFAKITEQGLESLRRRIGIKIEDTLEPWVTELNLDAIRHYAWGIGDDNPLWLDEAHAASSIHGRQLAPPSILYATNRVASGYCGGLPGVHAMFAGTNWTWFRPLYIGTKVKTDVSLKELVEHKTRFAGRSIQQIYHTKFFDGDGIQLAECDSWVFRTERDAARESSAKYDREKPRKIWTQDEIQAIAKRYATEEVRGATPRYWQDVSVGDSLPTLVKGPMTVTGFIAYVQGWGGLYVRAHKMAFKTFREHPGLGIPNEYGIPDVPERVHWDEVLARAVGVPGAYDYGPERISWMSHAVTNWMGDAGFLRKLDCKVVRHNPAGDVILISGEVSRKWQEEGRSLVAIELRGVQQDGEKSCTATAVVELPVK